MHADHARSWTRLNTGFRNVVITAACVSAIAPASAIAQDRAAEPLARLDWLSGCWQRTSGTRVVDEQWMAPRATLMLGMSRTVRDGKIIEWEQIRLAVDGDAVVFTASPSGQPTAQFRSTTVNDSVLIVENPTHDFPQLISYRRRGTDSLLARIEGSMNGTKRGVDFPYRRVACPGGR